MRSRPILSTLSGTLIFAAAALLFLSRPLLAQQTATPPPPADVTGPPQGAAPSSALKGSSSSNGRKSSPLPGFLIIGTVFNESSLAFPGAQIRIRRTGEKKFRWESFANSRGEFAVRVPDDHEYEVVVHAKKYQDQTRAVSTHNGDIQQRLSFKLEPLTPADSGAKK